MMRLAEDFAMVTIDHLIDHQSCTVYPWKPRRNKHYRFAARRVAQNREKNANLARACPAQNRIETAV